MSAKTIKSCVNDLHDAAAAKDAAKILECCSELVKAAAADKPVVGAGPKTTCTPGDCDDCLRELENCKADFARTEKQTPGVVGAGFSWLTPELILDIINVVIKIVQKIKDNSTPNAV